jgi:hypothetical protein
MLFRRYLIFTGICACLWQQANRKVTPPNGVTTNSLQLMTEVKWLLHRPSNEIAATNKESHYITFIYRLSQEERSICWEVTVSVILSKKVCTYMCPLPNGFRQRVISLYSTLYRRTTRHVLTIVAKCIDVDGGIFENILY